jgi:hypothetical protein
MDVLTVTVVLVSGGAQHGWAACRWAEECGDIDDCTVEIPEFATGVAQQRKGRRDVPCFAAPDKCR